MFGEGLGAGLRQLRAAVRPHPWAGPKGRFMDRFSGAAVAIDLCDEPVVALTPSPMFGEGRGGAGKQICAALASTDPERGGASLERLLE